MNAMKKLLSFIGKLTTILLGGTFFAIVGWLIFGNSGHVDTSWTEDVSLHDGTTVVVKRTAQGQALGEVGGPGGWRVTQMTLAIESPKTVADVPSWSQRWVPILIDYDTEAKEWFLVATFYDCSDWTDLGRPKLPYVEFRAKGGRWVQGTLTPALFGRSANLLMRVPADGKLKHITLEEKNGRDARAAKEYKAIQSIWITAC